MRTELVSIILPTFNRGYCLQAAVDSVRAQSHSDWELIVVDDGSTDDSHDRMSRYADDKRIRYIRRPNGGVAAARNTGLTLATGDFIAFLDSDDLWKPFKLRLQLDVLRALPEVGMVWTEMEAVRADGHRQSGAYLTTMYDNYARFPKDELFSSVVALDELAPRSEAPVRGRRVLVGSIFSAMIAGNLVHTSTVMLRRDLAEQVGGFDELLRPTGEDFDYHLRTCRAARVALIDLATITYMTGRDDQLTCADLQHFMAVNYLRTITAAIEQHRHLLDWSDAELRALLASGHAWAGLSCYYVGDYAGARRHLLRSLGHRWAWRVALYAGITVMPAAAVSALRTTVRLLRQPAVSEHDEGTAAA